ncbi:MAG: ribosomal RNA small subunit methyltransferase A [Chloroflexi bacterium]|nr:ribosomal RNA small subunit methyltransferase A [Chloroflexota bacterium]
MIKLTKPAAPADVRAELRRFGLHARKVLGQHFLTDQEALADILRAAELKPGDIVIEIGPGMGILTEALAARAGQVIAVELDERLAGLLEKRLAAYRNVSIVQGSILDMDPGWLLAKYPDRAGGPYKVVANLPYYITSPILRHLLERATVKPSLMVIMVQKEVAEVITAPPGEMSLLTVSVRFYGVATVVRTVPAASFFPAPKVDSAIVKIEVLPEPALAVDDVGLFFRLVAAGFKSKRKQLHNALLAGLALEKDRARACLEEAGIDPERRAQTLDLEEWRKLYEVLRKEGVFREGKREKGRGDREKGDGNHE